jgi:hypothetical protein
VIDIFDERDDWKFAAIPSAIESKKFQEITIFGDIPRKFKLNGQRGWHFMVGVMAWRQTGRKRTRTCSQNDLSQSKIPARRMKFRRVKASFS